LNDINKHITYENIQRHIDDGLIRVQTHPIYQNLKILNYTQTCQFEKKWTPLTKAARGLVVDFDGMVVVARPFEKFFNLSEHVPSDIPTNLSYDVYEKMDGSLGILFNYNGEWIWCTRGSFTSDQCIWAKNWFESNHSEMYDDLEESYTHLFEILYTDNRIVVGYDYEGLVSLGSIHTETGIEVGPNDKFRMPLKYDMTLEELVTYKEANFEGFVIQFSNGFRVKVKTEEYVHLHRIVFGLSTYRVWDALREGNLEALMNDLPEEFQPWVNGVVRNLMEKFHMQSSIAYTVVNHSTVEGDRKQTALNYQKVLINPAAAFAILDGKDPSELIWKTLKPAFETIQ